ncbi:TPA: YIP1 family protein [Pseudomonas aeruginosa]|nr:YIP1 family protein [Pseudomonas aeruginosa]
MIHHVWGLFTHPDQEWQEIRGEEESISHMYLTHILILAAIPAISAYIGTTQVGWVVGGGDPVKLTQASALQMTVLTYLAMLAGVAAISYTVYLLYVGIPTFMNIHKDEGFLFSSSVLAVGLVVLVAMIALSVILWGSGVGPEYTS